MPLLLSPPARNCSRYLLAICRPPFLTALAGAAAFGSALQTDALTARAGETVAGAVRLVGEQEVLSGLQFDLEADPALQLRLGPGSALPASAKLFMQSAPLPGIVRVLIVGMNRLPLPDQDLVQLFITVDASAPPFDAAIAVRNPVAATPGGAQTPLRADPIKVRILNGPATQFLPPSGLLNAASLQPGPVSPGELVTLFGSITSPDPSLFFDGIQAPILYAGPGQINAMVPYELQPGTTATVELRQGSRRSVFPVPVAAAAPALFTAGSGGTGQGASLNQDYSANSPSSPAPAGSTVMLFGTGFGRLASSPAAASLSLTSSPVTATIHSVPAEVTYAGAAPGLSAGVVQINLRLPPSLPANSYAAVSLQIAGHTTSPGVTLSVQSSQN